MVRKRQNFTQRKDSERRFRFRVRFEQPPGGGTWIQEDAFFEWLDERLGKGNWGFHEDDWEGHGFNCRALHFDDHSVIPDLLKRYAAIYLAAPRKFLFTASFTREQAQILRDAIGRLQQYLVDQMNRPVAIVTWAMGTLTFLHGRKASVGENMKASRIRDLSEITRQLNVFPVDAESVALVLEDYQRGALEVGFAMWRDAKPPQPSSDTAALQLLISSLTQIESNAGENDKAQSQ